MAAGILKRHRKTPRRNKVKARHEPASFSVDQAVEKLHEFSEGLDHA